MANTLNGLIHSDSDRWSTFVVAVCLFAFFFFLFSHSRYAKVRQISKERSFCDLFIYRGEQKKITVLDHTFPFSWSQRLSWEIWKFFFITNLCFCILAIAEILCGNWRERKPKKITKIPQENLKLYSKPLSNHIQTQLFRSSFFSTSSLLLLLLYLFSICVAHFKHTQIQFWMQIHLVARSFSISFSHLKQLQIL